MQLFRLYRMTCRSFLLALLAMTTRPDHRVLVTWLGHGDGTSKSIRHSRNKFSDQRNIPFQRKLPAITRDALRNLATFSCGFIANALNR